MSIRYAWTSCVMLTFLLIHMNRATSHPKLYMLIYKDVLLDSMLCGCRLRFCFLSESFLFMPNPGINTPMSPCSLPNGLLFTPILSYGSVPLSAVPSVHRLVGDAKQEGGVDFNGWVRAGVRDAVFLRNIYFAKPNPEPNAHSGSRVWKGLGDRALRKTLEYDLANNILIRPLTQPVTCEIGSSIFAAMSRLKVVITTSVSLPIIPST